jgi:hypothetical protein
MPARTRVFLDALTAKVHGARMPGDRAPGAGDEGGASRENAGWWSSIRSLGCAGYFAARARIQCAPALELGGELVLDLAARTGRP